jgi:hypothetical protein
MDVLLSPLATWWRLRLDVSMWWPTVFQPSETSLSKVYLTPVNSGADRLESVGFQCYLATGQRHSGSAGPCYRPCGGTQMLNAVLAFGIITSIPGAA